MILSNRDILVLAEFFNVEFSVDSSSVAEWLDNEDFFDDEESRDEFIERVKKFIFAETGR